VISITVITIFTFDQQKQADTQSEKN